MCLVGVRQIIGEAMYHTIHGTHNQFIGMIDTFSTDAGAEVYSSFTTDV